MRLTNGCTEAQSCHCKSIHCIRCSCMVDQIQCRHLHVNCVLLFVLISKNLCCCRKRCTDVAENLTQSENTSSDGPASDGDLCDLHCSADDNCQGSENTTPDATKNAGTTSYIVDDHSSDNLPGNTNCATSSPIVPLGLSTIPARKDLRGLRVPNDLSELIGDGPRQPKMPKFPPTRFGMQNRCFPAIYYTKFPFLEYSVERDAVFCFNCRMFPSSASEPTFIHEGFNNWKDVGDSLGKHAKSNSHVDASARRLAWMQSTASGKPVAVQIDSHAKVIVEQNRSAVSSLAKVAIVCARQDIALRGTHETFSDNDETQAIANRGNFLELVNLIKSESSNVKSNLDRLPKNANYCSKDSQNDLLDSAASVIKNRIVEEVQRSGMFAVIVDEARDISKTEQMSVCLRYIDGHEVKERFLNFVTLRNDLSAEALAIAVANTLQSCVLANAMMARQLCRGSSMVCRHVSDKCVDPLAFMCTAMPTE